MLFLELVWIIKKESKPISPLKVLRGVAWFLRSHSMEYFHLVVMVNDILYLLLMTMQDTCFFISIFVKVKVFMFLRHIKWR